VPVKSFQTSWSTQPWVVVTWTKVLFGWRLDARCGICGGHRVAYANRVAADNLDPSVLGRFPERHRHRPVPDVRSWRHPWINPTGVFPDGLPASLLADVDAT